MDFDVKLKVDVDWIEVGLTWYELDGVDVKLNVKIFSDAWRSCCIFEWRYDVGFGYEAVWKGKKRRWTNWDEKGEVKKKKPNWDEKGKKEEKKKKKEQTEE